MGSDSVTRKAFPMRKAKLRSVELPMKENTDAASEGHLDVFTHGLMQDIHYMKCI